MSLSEIGIGNIEKKIEFSKPIILSKKDCPIEQLGSDEFEVLAYYLFDYSIVNKEKYQYDKAIYIKGGNDKGKDLVLKKSGKIVGIVQCKHSRNRTKSGEEKIKKEFLKMLLYIYIYPNDFNIKGKLKYIYMVSSTLSEKGSVFINKLDEYFKENEKLKLSLEEVIDNYSNIKKVIDNVDENVLLKIKKIYKKITFLYIDENDIILSLQDLPQVKDKFFSVQLVKVVHEFPDYIGKEDSEILNIIDYKEEEFYKALEEIEFKDEIKNNAILDFYKKQSLVCQLHDMGIIDLRKKIKSFEEEIVRIENSQRDEFIISIDEEEELKNIKTSKKYYLKLRKEIILVNIEFKGAGLSNSIFRCGTVHDLVNSGEIKRWKLGGEEE